MFNLKKLVEGAIAQVNMFDNGKTFATVQRNQPAPPAQIPQQGMAPQAQAQIQNAKYGVLANNPKRQRAFIGSVSQPQLKAFNPILEAPKVFAKEAVPTVGAGIGRSIVGTAEGLSGVADLATPGTGTSRVTKALVNQGRNIDQYVERNNFDKTGYKIAQGTTDIASFLAPGAIAKGASLAANTGGVTGKVGKALSSTAPLIDKPVLKYATSPANILNTGVGTARSQGYIASREQDVNPGTVGMGLGANLLLGTGANVVGSKVVEPLVNSNIGKNIKDGFNVAVSKPQAPEELLNKQSKLLTARAAMEVKNKPTNSIDSQINNVDQQIKQATTRPILRPFTNEIGAVGKNVNGRDEGKVFYHGTNNKDIKSLADLQAGRGVGKSSRNNVYITENPEIAKNFGSNVVSQKLYGKHLNAKDIGVETTPGWAQDRKVAPEFADYKTTKLLTDREKRVFENSFVKGIPTNTIIEDTPGIHKYLSSKGYTTITVPRVHSDVNGARTETIIIDKKAFQPQAVGKDVDGGTIRPDKTPNPDINPSVQGSMSSERASKVQANVDDMKAFMKSGKSRYAIDTPPTQKKQATKAMSRQDFNYEAMRIRDNLKAGETGYINDGGKTYEITRDSTRAKLVAPKEAFHSTASLEIEGGKLRASKDGAMGEGVYLHTNKDTARLHGAMQGDGNVADQNALKVKINTDNIYRLTDNNYPSPEQVNIIKKYGHDGIMLKDGEMVIFDPNKVELSQPPKSPPTVEKTPPDFLKTSPEYIAAESNPLPDGSKIVKKVSKNPETGMLESYEQRVNKTTDTPTTPSPTDQPEFDAVAGAARSNNSNRLAKAINENNEITEAAIKAQEDGKEVNFFAKKDKNGRGVGVEKFNPKYHRIESGFVIDNNGKVLGNHIKIDETGVQVNVGGDIVNMDSILGNQARWRGDYRVSETMDRNLQRLAPDEETYRKTRSFVIDNKTKNEAFFKEELRAQRQDLAQRAEATQAVKPMGVSKDEFNSDIFDFIENKMSTKDLKTKYGDGATQIIEYKKATRKLYDDLLDRVNTVYARYGEDLVPKRKDYITHINELMGKPSFAGEMYGQLQNSILGEGMQTTRGDVPGQIAGRTENFEPRKKWNRFFQRRQGGEFTKDPFKAVDAYLEPTLYNIHMTEPAVRARAVEAAFRAGDEFKSMDKTAVSEALLDGLDKYGGPNGKLVSGWQEYANALAGKTQRWDRQIIDASDATASALRGWQALQRVGGRSTILGNVQSIVAQSLNQPLVFAEAGPKNYLKGITSSLINSTPADQSPFLRARRTQTNSPFRSMGQKTLDVGGVPLRKTELAFVEQAWNANYHSAVEKGFKKQKAILEADRMTEQQVAGRGIADMPEMYRSTAANGFLQYTLEVAATNKKVWQDLTPTQKAKYVAAVYATNQIVGFVTGFQPLPDFLGAAIDTARDYAEDDDRNSLQKAGAGVQRFADAGVSFNPLTSAGVNAFIPQGLRKDIFGQDSQLGRFEGTAAPAQVVQNAIGAGVDVAKGNLTAARDRALRVAPFGNQARKTLTGAEMIQRGYAVDSKGNPTYPAPTSLGGKAQALVFGPSSTTQARQYYNNDQRAVTGKGDLVALAGSTNKAQTLKDIQDRRKNGTSKEQIVKASFNTPQAQQFFAQSEDEQKAQAANNPELYALMKQKDAMQKALGTPTLNPGLNEQDKKVLTKAARLTQKAEDEVSYREKDYDYKKLLANYNKNKLEGNITEEEDIKQQKALKKAEVGAQFDKGIRKLYELSKTDLQAKLKDQPNAKDIIAQLEAYDKALVDSKYHAYLKFKNGVMAVSGGRKRGGRKGGRRGGKGSKGNLSTQLYAFNSSPVGTNRTLRQLVANAKVKGAKSKKIKTKIA